MDRVQAIRMDRVAMRNGGAPGSRGRNGGPSQCGQDWIAIVCDIPDGATGSYTFRAYGGNGGPGGRGGAGGQGGDGQKGGRGGNGVNCCLSRGIIGNGGDGGLGGIGGEGGIGRRWGHWRLAYDVSFLLER
jgi:hypothetical protein